MVKPLREFLAGEEDVTTFSISHPKHIPLYASPLAEEGQENDKLSDHSSKEYQKISRHMQRDPEEPPLRVAHESQTIQLFYDLFFVANLTTFTSAHEVNNGQTLSSYVGYFSVLWFTWLQVAFFDVRFSNDSALERLCKALQFGVMTGLAVVGPSYDPNEPEENAGFFQTLALILMVSRLILAAQYGIAWFWTKDYRKAHLPLIGHMVIEFFVAMVFLGLSFTFHRDTDQSVLHGDIGFYVMSAVEAVGVLALSGRTKFLSFRKTAIVERLGLLTLIILGEGVIGLTSLIRKAGTDSHFTSNTIGQIISSVVIIYFLWMLYFDQIETERVGEIRQHYWIVLHFPFHVAVLLVVEGAQQLSNWRKILDIVNPFENAIFDIAYNTTGLLGNNVTGTLGNNETAMGVVEAVNETVNSLLEKLDKSEYVQPDISYELWELDYPALNQTDVFDILLNVTSKVEVFIFDTFGVVSENKQATSNEEIEDDQISVFGTVFLYFFISAGAVLILLAALFWLGKRRKSRGEYLSIAVRVLMGIALTFVALLYANSSVSNGNRFVNYFLSPWMLPTVVVAYGIVILLDTILVNYVKKQVLSKSASNAV